jgi:hypothetical protein
VIANATCRYNSDSGKPQREITNLTAIKTFQKFYSPLSLSTTSDNSMWCYGVTGIAHVAFRCKSCKTLGGIDSSATSLDIFACSATLQHNFAADTTLTDQTAIKCIKMLKNIVSKFKGPKPFKLKKIFSDPMGNHKLSIDTTFDPC